MRHKDMLSIIGTGVVFLSICLGISACGKSSSSSDSGGETDTTKCGKSGSLYIGCYTEGSDASAVWTGACKLDSVDTGEYVILNFLGSSKCAFESVRAKGEVGNNWKELGTVDSWTAAEFLIQHTEEKVYTLRFCVNGVNDSGEKHKCM